MSGDEGDDPRLCSALSCAPLTGIRGEALTRSFDIREVGLTKLKTLLGTLHINIIVGGGQQAKAPSPLLALWSLCTSVKERWQD